MAAVFLATDTRSNHRVALKLVPMGSDREAQDILDAERWGAKLQEQFCRSSRYVPAVYEHDTGFGYFYIAMEYLEGQNLSDVITSGPLAPERAVGIAIQLCQFLEAAHGFEVTIDGRNLRALLHGDLKPRNIRVLDGDQIKVLDFGIAKALSLSRKVTRNDFGSIAYLSPERLESGESDAHVDLWAVGVLLYEMVSGVQPFQAPDTRRLEQLIRSRRQPPSLDGQSPIGVQAVIAKLLAPNLADRYVDAGAIRQDLEWLRSGRQTQAQLEGWPKAETSAADEPSTRRTRPAVEVDQEATRRTVTPPVPAAATRPTRQPVPDPRAIPPPQAATWPRRRRRFVKLRTALLILALMMVFNEMSVASRAQRLAAVVRTRELDGLGDLWGQYDRLRGRSLGIGIMRLERALVDQTEDLTDRVINNYRTRLPSVREAQWKMAYDALAYALSVSPGDHRLKASLRYCEGHLHRINGEARKAKRQTSEAQEEFTDAVAAFREAAELRPNWPDPFLGLTRTFIYGLEDVDRGADALQQAQKFGFTPGDRETAQLADGYRTRGDTFVTTARTLTGMGQEHEYLTRAAEAYRQALELYGKALGFADVPRNMRLTQRGLARVEQRLAELAHPAGESSPPDREPVSRELREQIAEALRTLPQWR
jgi:serine/threonine-protein kinase